MPFLEIFYRKISEIATRDIVISYNRGRVVVKRLHHNDEDVVSNPTATRNRQTKIGH